jgi:hypothetical protein
MQLLRSITWKNKISWPRIFKTKFVNQTKMVMQFFVEVVNRKHDFCLKGIYDWKKLTHCQESESSSSLGFKIHITSDYLKKHCFSFYII